MSVTNGSKSSIDSYNNMDIDSQYCNNTLVVINVYHYDYINDSDCNVNDYH